MFRNLVQIPKTFVRISGKVHNPKLIAGIRTNQHQLFLRYFADVPVEHPEDHMHDHEHHDEHLHEKSKKEIASELMKEGEEHHHHHHKHKYLHVHDDLSHNAEELQNLLQSEQNIGKRVTYIAIALNFVLGVAKASAAVYSHSQALLSDAVHTLSDLLADLVTLYCIHVARRAPSTKFPYGPGKVENVFYFVIYLSFIYIYIYI